MSIGIISFFDRNFVLTQYMYIVKQSLNYPDVMVVALKCLTWVVTSLKKNNVCLTHKHIYFCLNY